jgi:hypothetical protein
MTTLPIRSSIGGSPLRLGFILIALTLACFALSPTVHAQCPTVCDSNENTALGNAALGVNTGGNNTAIGFDALWMNTTGGSNTAIGAEALYVNTTGGANTAIGYQALFYNTSSNNTATGRETLSANTTGSNNTATGSTALSRNTTGHDNTANGYQALSGYPLSNTHTGNYNTADGSNALFNNTTGSDNTATGFDALYSNSNGEYNTATGFEALYNNMTGTRNTADGVNALIANQTGSYNTAIGTNALNKNTASYNTAIGEQALIVNTSGSNNVGLGYNAGSNLTTGSGNVCIGAGIFGVAGESNTTRMANVYASVVSGRAVYVNSANKIGTLSSSRRYKEEIKPMDKASETLFALNPVTFRYKKEIDSARALSFGLIAEEVAKVNPDLVTSDEEGKPQTVRYEAINAMLLNEFLKEHKVVEEQGATVAELKKQIATLIATVKEQASQIRKVSAKIEVTKPEPQTVADNQ